MDNSMSQEVFADQKESVTPKPSVVQEMESAFRASHDYYTAESERETKLKIATKTDDEEGIARYSVPLAKSEEVKKGDQLAEIANQTARLCNKPEELSMHTEELIKTKTEHLTPEKLIEIATIVEDQTTNPRNSELAGKLTETYPDVIHTAHFNHVAKELVKKTEYHNELKQYAPTKGNTKNIDKLIEATVREDSPFDHDTKERLIQFKTEIAGYRLRNFVDVVHETKSNSRLGTAFSASEITEKLTGIVNIDQQKLQKAMGNYTGREEVGLALAKLAKTTDSESDKKKLRFLALGFAEATLDSLPTLDPYSRDNGSMRDKRTQMWTATGKLLAELADPDTSILEYRRRSDVSKEDQFFQQEVNKLVEKGNYGMHGDVLDIQHREVIDKRWKIEEAERAKRKKEADEAERLAKEAEKAAQAEREVKQIQKNKEIAALINSDPNITNNLDVLTNPEANIQAKEAAKRVLTTKYETSRQQDESSDLTEALKLASNIANQLESKQRWSSPDDSSIDRFNSKRGPLGIGGTTYFPSSAMLQEAEKTYDQIITRPDYLQANPNTIIDYETARRYQQWLESVAWKKQSDGSYQSQKRK